MSHQIYVKDTHLAYWLDDFFDYAEKGRLSRGQDLYQVGDIIDFTSSDGGFTAKVQGSGTRPYQVKATFDQKKGASLPDPGTVSLDCSCPDSYELCKHTIGAVINWIVQMERKTIQSSNIFNIKWTESPKTNTPQISEQFFESRAAFRKLQELAKDKPPAVRRFQTAGFWKAEPELNALMVETYEAIRNAVKRSSW